eukprot:333925-Pyramimonas_sp.AAC.1
MRCDAPRFDLREVVMGGAMRCHAMRVEESCDLQCVAMRHDATNCDSFGTVRCLPSHAHTHWLGSPVTSQWRRALLGPCLCPSRSSYPPKAFRSFSMFFCDDSRF